MVYAVYQLADLTEYERDDGTVAIFQDFVGRIVHVVTMLDQKDTWACFCADATAADGECVATTYCRIRVEEECDD